VSGSELSLSIQPTQVTRTYKPMNQSRSLKQWQHKQANPKSKE